MFAIREPEPAAITAAVRSRVLRAGLAARLRLVQPRRFLGALVCTLAVMASASTVPALARFGNTAFLSAMFGGVVAFNLLLFFPPGTLTARPLRIIGALPASAVPFALAPLLYHVSPALADAALLLAAAVSVLVRPLGPPVAGFALLIALNLLIPLVMGAALSLAPLGALAGVSGTIFAVAADVITARLLRAMPPGFERRLLRNELAGFFAELLELRQSGGIWPQPDLSARIARVRLLRDEIAPAAASAMPVDALLEDVGRCAARLGKGTAAMSAESEAAVARALAALAEATRAGRAGGAQAAIEDLRRAALRRPGPDEPEPPPARMLGLALLLSDLVEAAMPRPGAAPCSTAFA